MKEKFFGVQMGELVWSSEFGWGKVAGVPLNSNPLIKELDTITVIFRKKSKIIIKDYFYNGKRADGESDEITLFWDNEEVRK